MEIIRRMFRSQEERERNANNIFTARGLRPNHTTIDSRSDPIENLADEEGSDYESFFTNGYQVEIAFHGEYGVSEGAVYREDSEWSEPQLADFHEVLRAVERSDPDEEFYIVSPSVTRDAYGDRKCEPKDEELDRMLEMMEVNPKDILSHSNPKYPAKNWLYSARHEIKGQAEKIHDKHDEEFTRHTWHNYPDLAANFFTEKVLDELQGVLDEVEYTRFVNFGDKQDASETAERLTQIPYSQRTSLSTLKQPQGRHISNRDLYDRNTVLISENQSLRKLDILNSPLDGIKRTINDLAE